MIKKNRRLIIIAPNDRYNYGDLLFSYVIKFHLAKYYDEVIDVSTIDNDLSHVGGNLVRKISYLYDLDSGSDNDIIVAGGESFCSKWRVCVAYLSPVYVKILKFVRKGLSGVLGKPETYNSVADYFAKVFIGGKTRFPYTLGKSEVKNARYVFYNSLGGSFIKDKQFSKDVMKILKSVDYIAIRDRSTFELVKSAGITTKLYPDCAVQMADIFPKANLEKLVLPHNQQFVRSEGNGYIAFQINKRLGTLNYSEIISLIRNVHEKYKKKVYLCPVGFALGHEDNVVLEKIYKELKDEGIVFYSPNNTIWDIMYVIGSSSLYVGTSLHGAITAMSFNVPYLGVIVNKTIQYVKEWGVKGLPTTSKDLNIMDEIDVLLKADSMSYCTNSELQKKLVTESFSNMSKIIGNQDVQHEMVYKH